MYSRYLFGFALLVSACGSDDSSSSLTFGYVEGPLWAGAKLSDPVALGSHATIRFWDTELGGASVSTSDPSVATFELTRSCLCVDERSAKPGAGLGRCGGGERWDCFDDIEVATHGVGNAELLLESPNIADISTNIQVRDVASSGFFFVDQSLTSHRVEAITMRREELGLLTLRLFDAAGSELFGGKGPSWVVTDPALLRLTGRAGAGPLAAQLVESSEVFAEALGYGDTEVIAEFAHVDVDRTLAVSVR